MSDASEPLGGSSFYFHTPTLQAVKGFLYPICIGHYYCDSNYRIQRNSFDSFLMGVVIEGSGYFEVDSVVAALRKGDIFILDCYKEHTYGADGSLEFFWIHFDGITARHYYESVYERYHNLIRISGESLQEALRPVKKILEGFEAGAACKEVQMSKYITDMLTSILMADEEVYVGRDDQSAVDKAITYIRQNYSRNVTVEELAVCVSLSPYYFIRQFKKIVGLTPHHYITAVRINSARFYLRTTEKSIKEIGYMCGFQSENSFCITFKKQTGQTPTLFRKNA